MRNEFAVRLLCEQLMRNDFMCKGFMCKGFMCKGFMCKGFMCNTKETAIINCCLLHEYDNISGA